MSIAANGRDALEMVKSVGGAGGGLSLVVTDMLMPQMGGVELCERIRAWEAEDPARGHVPVWALTGNVLGEHRAECERAGMDGFLVKPLKVSALADLARAVGRAPPAAPTPPPPPAGKSG